MPPFGQGMRMDAGSPLLSLVAHWWGAAPTGSLGRAAASCAQQPFNQVSVYQWLIVVTRQCWSNGPYEILQPPPPPTPGSPRHFTGPLETATSPVLPGHGWCPPATPAGWAAWQGGEEGRKPTTLSPALPFGHNCSSTGAKGRLKFSLQRQCPSSCFISISLPPTRESEQVGGTKQLPFPSQGPDLWALNFRIKSEPHLP